MDIAKRLINRLFRLEEIKGHDKCPTYLRRWTLLKFRLWFIRETDKARLYAKVPPERHPTTEDEIWVPRSIAEHTSKRGSEHTLELPDWWIERNGL